MLSLNSQVICDVTDRSTSAFHYRSLNVTVAADDNRKIKTFNLQCKSTSSFLQVSVVRWRQWFCQNRRDGGVDPNRRLSTQRLINIFPWSAKLLLQSNNRMNTEGLFTIMICYLDLTEGNRTRDPVWGGRLGLEQGRPPASVWVLTSVCQQTGGRDCESVGGLTSIMLQLIWFSYKDTDELWWRCLPESCTGEESWQVHRARSLCYAKLS